MCADFFPKPQDLWETTQPNQPTYFRRCCHVAFGVWGCPGCLPQAADTDSATCKIIKRGYMDSVRIVTSQGVFLGRRRKYSCHTHKSEWTFPLAAQVTTPKVQGHLLEKVLVDDSFWPRAWRVWVETEDWCCLQRDLRSATSDRISWALRDREDVRHLPQQAQAALHDSLLQAWVSNNSQFHSNIFFHEWWDSSRKRTLCLPASSLSSLPSVSPTRCFSLTFRPSLIISFHTDLVPELRRWSYSVQSVAPSRSGSGSTWRNSYLRAWSTLPSLWWLPMALLCAWISALAIPDSWGRGNKTNMNHMRCHWLHRHHLFFLKTISPRQCWCCSNIVLLSFGAS